MPIDLANFRYYSIAFIFSILFGTTAFEKLKSLSTPDWFKAQFAKTFLTKIPGAITGSYWVIAMLETLIFLLFVASFVNLIFLPLALTGASFLFGILLFGLRITHDYQGSANMFIYFTATMFCLYLALGQN